MVHAVQRVATNTLVFTLALTIQKIFSFVYFALLARSLGAHDVGIYTFALSFTTIFIIFIDFGFTQVLTREIANGHSRWKDIFFNIISLKLFLAAIIYIVVLGIIAALDYDPIIFRLVLLSGGIMVLDSFTLTIWGVFRGAHILSYESIANVLVQVVMVTLGMVVLFTSKDLFLLIGANLVASLFHFVYAAYLLVKRMGVQPKFVFEYSLLKNTFFSALPFGLASVFNRVYSYIDTVFLTKIVGETALGYYSAANRFIFALQFIPMAFSATIYPAMSAYYKKDEALLAKIFERSTHYLFIIAVPISLGGFVLAEELIVTVYGDEFLSSVRVFGILLFSLIFLFANFPVGAYLNATHQQKINTINQGFVMILSIVLNFLLVPRLSFVGSGIAFLSSSIVLWALGSYRVMRSITLDYTYLARKISRTFLAAVCMTFFAILLKEYIHVALLIVLCAVIYPLLLLSFNAINKAEAWKLLKSIRPNEKRFTHNR